MEILIAENEDVARLLRGGLGDSTPVIRLSPVAPDILAHTPWESVFVCVGDERGGYAGLLVRAGRYRPAVTVAQIEKAAHALRRRYIERKPTVRSPREVWRVSAEEEPCPVEGGVWKRKQ